MEQKKIEVNQGHLSMSTNEDQEEKLLPEVLAKLEIVPTMPIINLTDDDKCLPLRLNPFYNEIKQSHDYGYNENAEETIIKLFGPKCNCEASKISNGSHIEHKIINRTKFKHKHNRTRLKESSLKPLHQYCVHNCHNTNHMPIEGSTLNTLELSDYPSLDDLRLDDNNLKTNITKSDTKQSKQLHQLEQSLQNKNFTTLQSCDERITKRNKSSINNNLNVSKDCLTINNSNSTSGNLQNNNNNISSNLLSSSSCSQQARNNNSTASTACDVTIDELASYFETFVHIPKKMSTMAEMMYI